MLLHADTTPKLTAPAHAVLDWTGTVTQGAKVAAAMMGCKHGGSCVTQQERSAWGMRAVLP
jgi:hypothetical protein